MLESPLPKKTYLSWSAALAGAVAFERQITIWAWLPGNDGVPSSIGRLFAMLFEVSEMPGINLPAVSKKRTLKSWVIRAIPDALFTLTWNEPWVGTPTPPTLVPSAWKIGGWMIVGAETS